MGGTEFINTAMSAVQMYINDVTDAPDEKIELKDIYVVWMCKTLQNCKGLFSTTRPDGMYYEVTYDGDKEKLYLDAYKKWENVVIVRDIKDEITD